MAHEVIIASVVGMYEILLNTEKRCNVYCVCIKYVSSLCQFICIILYHLYSAHKVCLR